MGEDTEREHSICPYNVADKMKLHEDFALNRKTVDEVSTSLIELRTEMQNTNIQLTQIMEKVSFTEITNGGGRNIRFNLHNSKPGKKDGFFQMLYDKPWDRFTKFSQFSSSAMEIIKFITYAIVIIGTIFIILKGVPK